MANFNWYGVVGTILGIFLRTVGPWLILWFGGKVPFDYAYLRSAAFAACLTALGGGYVLPVVAPEISPAAAIFSCMFIAYAAQDGTREGEKAIIKKINQVKYK